MYQKVIQRPSVVGVPASLAHRPEAPGLSLVEQPQHHLDEEQARVREQMPRKQLWHCLWSA